MAKAVSPSMLTPGQIAKFLDLQTAALRKSDLPVAETQIVLESQGSSLANEFVAMVRKRVEAISNLIVRRVKVDRSRTPQAVLDATGREQYVDRKVVAAMPRGMGEEAETVFFKPGASAYDKDGLISDEDLEKQFELRSLVPEDPYSLAAQNEADPAFADEHRHATHWKDEGGFWCHALFYHWRDERIVDVNRSGGRRLSDYWSFAGRRK